MTLLLNENDQKMLNGDEGPLVKEAMRFLVQLGETFGAKRMIDLEYAYVYIDGMGSSWGAGELSQDILAEAIDSGLQVKIPTTTWVSGREMDESLYPKLGITGDILDELDAESQIGKKLGMIHIDTCSPYIVSDFQYGAHIASIESSAVTFLNSFKGVKTNRDGISAFYGALTGRYPEFGMHITENRRGTHLFNIKHKMRNSADYSALGYLIGQLTGLDVPVLDGPPRMSLEEMQCFSAAIAVGGAVSMAHIIGVTPEAPTLEAAFQGQKPKQTFDINTVDIEAIYDEYSSQADTVDFICLGCPHASMHDIRKYAELFKGKKVAEGVTVWLMTACQNLYLAKTGGELDILKEAGVSLQNNCPMVNPGNPGPNHTFHNPDFSVGHFATNSMKLLYYSQNCIRPTKNFFGSTERCVKAAITGRWE